MREKLGNFSKFTARTIAAGAMIGAPLFMERQSAGAVPRNCGTEEAKYVTSGYKWTKNPVGISAPAGYEDVIWEAAHMWEEVANINFVVGNDIVVDILPEISENPKKLGNTDLHGTIDGRPGELGFVKIKLYAPSRLTKNDKLGIVLHEFGHAGGLLESEGWCTVLAPIDDAYPLLTKPTQIDIDGMQSLYGAPLNDGWNYEEWKSTDPNPEHCNCKTVYKSIKDGWQRWSKDGPDYTNSLTSLNRGETYWIEK